MEINNRFRCCMLSRQTCRCINSKLDYIIPFISGCSIIYFFGTMRSAIGKEGNRIDRQWYKWLYPTAKPGHYRIRLYPFLWMFLIALETSMPWKQVDDIPPKLFLAGLFYFLESTGGLRRPPLTQRNRNYFYYLQGFLIMLTCVILLRYVHRHYFTAIIILFIFSIVMFFLFYISRRNGYFKQYACCRAEQAGTDQPEGYDAEEDQMRQEQPHTQLHEDRPSISIKPGEEGGMGQPPIELPVRGASIAGGETDDEIVQLQGSGSQPRQSGAGVSGEGNTEDEQEKLQQERGY